MKKLFQSGITSVSRPSEVFTSFRGPLISYRIVKSVNRETGILRGWTVFSQGKRSSLVRYLFGKLLWDELNTKETTIFFHLKEVTTDRTIYLSLKALALGIPKKLLRRRLESGQFLGLKFITRQQYLSVKGQVNFFFIEETVNLRKSPKFSGYTKHYKDKGSLGLEKDEYISEILEPDYDVSEETLLSYLTVGEISLSGGVFYPDEDKKVRNGSSRDNDKSKQQNA